MVEISAHANAMAQKLANAAEQIPSVSITQKVEANEIFAIIPREKITKLQNECFFYVWDEDAAEVRWVCSFDTTEMMSSNSPTYCVKNYVRRWIEKLLPRKTEVLPCIYRN